MVVEVVSDRVVHLQLHGLVPGACVASRRVGDMDMDLDLDLGPGQASRPHPQPPIGPGAAPQARPESAGQPGAWGGPPPGEARASSELWRCQEGTFSGLWRMMMS